MEPPYRTAHGEPQKLTVTPLTLGAVVRMSLSMDSSFQVLTRAGHPWRWVFRDGVGWRWTHSAHGRMPDAEDGVGVREDAARPTVNNFRGKTARRGASALKASHRTTR